MERIEQAAKEWMESHQSDELNYSVERKDSDLWFSVKDTNTCHKDAQSVNFMITFQENDDQRLSVWSENPLLQQHIGPILEFCDSAKDITVADILDQMNSAISAVIKSQHTTAGIDDDDGSDGGDEYYDYGVDHDGEDMEVESRDPVLKSSDDEEERFFQGAATTVACQRLVKDLKNMKKEANNFGFEASPRGDNLFLWDVKLTGFSSESPLGKDIENWARKHKREPAVYMEMQFPGDYPMSPPFARVIRPRFKFLTGHVTIGGSICMEMLTKSGWTPTNDIEGILVQIRSEIMSDPNARLDPNPDREYGEAEARDAFNRMVTRYGWNK